MENKALGKGLSALIPSKKSISNLESISNLKNNSRLEINSQGNVSFIKTNLIKDNSLQPRQSYDQEKLAKLTDSIKEKGILQPILVRKSGNAFEVIAGERRLRAARALSLEEVPVIVKNVTDREALVLALVENIQREELNPIEEAQGFKRLIEEFNFTQDSVAESVGKDRSTVTNLLRILRLPQEIQNYVSANKISTGHARTLLGLDSAHAQKQMADAIVAKGLSVRAVEQLVKRATEQGNSKKSAKALKSKDRDIEILEEDLRKILGTKVTVEDNHNKGKLVIEYYSLDDLDLILAVIRK